MRTRGVLDKIHVKIKINKALKRGYIELNYNADASHSGLTTPG